MKRDLAKASFGPEWGPTMPRSVIMYAEAHGWPLERAHAMYRARIREYRAKLAYWAKQDAR